MLKFRIFPSFFLLIGLSSIQFNNFIAHVWKIFFGSTTLIQGIKRSVYKLDMTYMQKLCKQFPIKQSFFPSAIRPYIVKVVLKI